MSIKGKEGMNENTINIYVVYVGLEMVEMRERCWTLNASIHTFTHKHTHMHAHVQTHTLVYVHL